MVEAKRSRERYRIVEWILTLDLEREINQLMAERWKLHGHLLVVQITENEGLKRTQFIQAMAKQT